MKEGGGRKAPTDVVTTSPRLCGSHGPTPALPASTEPVSSLLFHAERMPTDHPAQLSHVTETETLVGKPPEVTAMKGGAPANARHGPPARSGPLTEAPSSD